MAAAAESAHGRPDHLERTAEEPREEHVAEATIVEVREETPAVRELVFEVAGPFSFKAGNWVDFFIPGMQKVGGYSMCSVPAELPKLRLAVKRSTHPPAAWCHSEAASPGAKVELKAGGQFFWDPARDGPTTEHLLLVAGGIGINPLYSMAQAALGSALEAVPKLRRVSVLYSASSPSELAFRAHLEEMAQADERLRLGLRVTRNEAAEPWSGDVGRIDASVLAATIEEAQVPREGVLAYVCGPPAMTDEIVAVLQGPLELPEERVRFEKWW